MMAIVVLQSPPGDIRKLESDLAAWVAGGLAQGWDDTASIDATQGIPVYEIGAEDAASAQPLAAARHERNRHLLLTSGTPCYADLATGQSAGGPRLIELVCGEAAERLADALQSAEQFADDGDYHLRILDVPACDMTALWLAGPLDRLIPFRGDIAGQAPATEAFLARVGEIAAARRDVAGTWENDQEVQ